jgi:prepilin-type N-terminal cleavage/methylation domain-containing protein
VIRNQNGFTFIEILVALIITAICLVGVSQLLAGALRAHHRAETMATAAMVADLAMEYTLLHGNDTATAVFRDFIRQAEQDGYHISIIHRPAPIQSFQSVHVTVSGDMLRQPVQIVRLITDSSVVSPELAAGKNR